MPTPDLCLTVHHQVDSTQVVLSFQLELNGVALDTNARRYGPIILSVDLWQYLRDLIRDIEYMPLKTDAEQEIARRKVEAKGIFLLDNFLPDDLAETLWNLHGKMQTFLIQSTEAMIPWELFKLRRRSNGRIEQGPFFCEAFALTRWIIGFSPQLEFVFRNIAWISPRNKGFVGDQPVAFEITGHKVELVSGTFLGVHDALAAGSFDVFHFSGHGYAHSTPIHSNLQLEDEDLTPEDLAGAAGNLGVAKPLVFLNACQTGFNLEVLSGISGWAAQFIKAGCGGFIGAYWALRDRAASSFQETFYRNLLRGLPFGESARRARMEARSSGGFTWLAYTVYAHPEARVRLHQERERKIPASC